jgi:hypothetical protein
MAAKVLAVRPTVARKRFASSRAGLLIGGLAVAALILAGVLFRPTAISQPPSTARVAVSIPGADLKVAGGSSATRRSSAQKPQSTPQHAIAARKLAKSRALPQPAARAAVPVKPATAARAVQQPAPAQVAAVVAAPAHPLRRAPAYQPEAAGAVVALGGIEAFYGPRGRAVRVIWSSAQQASANVALIDDRGTTVNAVTVRGARQAVTMRLPRRFHGPLTVEVSSVGRLGERVAETTSLPAFGQ